MLPHLTRPLRVLDLAAARSHPGTLLQRLHQHLGLAGDPTTIEVPHFVESPEIAGHALWLSGACEQDARELAHFLRSFSRAASVRNAAERPVLVGCFELEALDPVPVSDTGLVIRWWWGRVTPLDTRVVVDAAMLPGRVLGDVDVVAEVATFDVDLAARLASDFTGDIRRDLTIALADDGIADTSVPDAILSAGPAEPHEPPASLRDLWVSGCVDWWGDRAVAHAGCLANGPVAALEMRVWRGQVAAILPFVEVHRERLAHWVAARRHQLNGGWGDRDILGMEAGPMFELFRKHPRLQESRGAWEIARTLRDTRHGLAHLEVLERDWWAQREQWLRTTPL